MYNGSTLIVDYLDPRYHSEYFRFYTVDYSLIYFT